MKKLIIYLSVIISTVALAAAGDRYITNTNQDKDVIIQVNDGGTVKDAIKVEGATGTVLFPTLAGLSGSFGAATGADHYIQLRNGVGGFFGWDDSANSTILQSPNTRKLQFQTNSDTFSGGTNAGEVSSTGAWTLGPSSGGVTHTVNGAISGVSTIHKASATPTIGDGAVDSMFLAETNAAYMVMAAQLSGNPPKTTTCFVYAGSTTTTLTINEIETTNEISCVQDPSGFVRLRNETGGIGSGQFRWSYIQLY